MSGSVVGRRAGWHRLKYAPGRRFLFLHGLYGTVHTSTKQVTFSHLEVPDEPTAVRHLLLSLDPRKAVAGSRDVEAFLSAGLSLRRHQQQRATIRK